MRVISGSARGKKLGELSGNETRPTTDRVKEGLFNAIQFEVPGAVVLDLFAGTGQLGIECLSRGAERAVFVDSRKDAVDLIRRNLAMTRMQDRAQVVQADAISWLAGCRTRFDLIFLDPPYGSGLLESSMRRIMEIDILSKNGIIICESRHEAVLPERIGSLARYREYRYGKIKVTTFRTEDSMT